MRFVETDVTTDLYHEAMGDGVPILLIPPSGATSSTWGPLVEDLHRIGRVITYDRRGYARSGGRAVRNVSTHTADAAKLLESLDAAPAVVVGTSAGAMIAVDLAVRRPDLVRAVIEHEGPWRFTRRLPTRSQVSTFAAMGSSIVRGRSGEAAEALLRSAYSYREGGSAWDAFPEEWQRVARENANATLWDFLTTIRNYPTAADLATLSVPVVCSYGARSPDFMVSCTRSFAAAIPEARVRRIEGAAHAVAFDAADAFARLIADTICNGDMGLGWFEKGGKDDRFHDA
jgi:pimeloyl-ACP methyl ester carboxylesterase